MHSFIFKKNKSMRCKTDVKQEEKIRTQVYSTCKMMQYEDITTIM